MLEVLSHRIVWAFLLLLVIVWRRGELADLRAAWRRPRTLAVLAASTTAIAVNWLVYIWAVQSGHVLDSSLGYFINPLVNVLFGVVLLHERLDRTIRVAVAIAGSGRAVARDPRRTRALDRPDARDVVRLVRAPAQAGARRRASSGSRSRRRCSRLSPAGTCCGRPPAGAPRSSLARPWLDALLLLAGPVTAIPLLFFAGAARRLPLSTLGFLQYLSPTLQFLLAVLVYREPLDGPRLVAFALIWTALAIFAVHTGRSAGRSV